jgi:hypothetical protein
MKKKDSTQRVTAGQKNGCDSMTTWGTGHPARLIWLTLLATAGLCPQLVWGTGLNWPTNQLLPTFSAPVSVLY